MTFPWDELNIIRSKLEKLQLAETAEDGGKKYDAERCVDIVYEYLEMCWTLGVQNANSDLNTSFAPQDAEMRAAIYEKVAGEDFTERIRKWAEKGDLDAIVRVAETDANRVLNDASAKTAKKAGAKYKIWVTMKDDKVRDTHRYLEGMKIPASDYFVTFDGDMAMEPEKFSNPENNVNCRCQIRYTYG